MIPSPHIELRGSTLVTTHIERWCFDTAPLAYYLPFDGFRTNEDKDASYPSIKFICPTCGDIWGERRIILHTSWRTPSRWQASLTPCQHHGSATPFTPFELQQYESGHDTIPHPLALRELTRQLNSDFPAEGEIL